MVVAAYEVCGLSDLLQAVFRRRFLLFPPSLKHIQTWYVTFQMEPIHYFETLLLYRLTCIDIGIG